ncbi:beta-carbonic anhydrase, cab [Glarea lozoyensis ATCC 20868]|uniref:Carbonic anhydrase n=1 Tax=Glarea lozoyensis (strain ATCC 20868 / MF5171) TaxID=1116229 RepID=S3DCM2_GLAL2|nr:beta-carbonic anhydrase, cab [Glarea lozoyensis ATCC 20868]EPE34804.1 beta-carbonic anhydrase, cab [Glarea lozoyensis ATCC 20868]
MPFSSPSLLSTPYTTLPIPRNLIPPRQSPSPSTTTTTSPTPHILWIGCTTTPTTDTNAVTNPRASMFIHRNLGPLLSATDLSTQSALEWSLNLLGVEHIVVCGHYGCSFLSTPSTSTEEQTTSWGVWGKDIAAFHAEHARLRKGMGKEEEEKRFEELYVLAEAEWLGRQEMVRKAVVERGLRVWAFVWDEERGEGVRVVRTGEKVDGEV